MIPIITVALSVQIVMFISLFCYFVVFVVSECIGIPVYFTLNLRSYFRYRKLLKLKWWRVDESTFTCGNLAITCSGLYNDAKKVDFAGSDKLREKLELRYIKECKRDANKSLDCELDNLIGTTVVENESSGMLSMEGR